MSDINKHAFFYGSATTIALLLYLALMTGINQVHNFNLRILNLIIIGIGVFLSIKNYLKKNDLESNYLSGLGVGALTSLTVALLFCLVASAILFSNPEFVQEIKELEPQGRYLNTVSVTVIMFMESLSAGLLFTYASMQWLKNDKPMSIQEN